MTQPSGSGGASFRVDLEQAPHAIKELQSALHQLEDIKSTAVALGNVNPGSGDSVSIEAAKLIGAAAFGAPGSLATALDEGIRQITHLIESLEADLADYGRGEVEKARGFA